MEQKENLNEDVKYLIRRIRETTKLIKDAKYVDAYHKSLGINQKLADLQGKIESGQIEVCESDCPKKTVENGTIISQGGKTVKYGSENVEKTG